MQGAVDDLFFDHRSEDRTGGYGHRGWQGLTLHGIGKHKTKHFVHYGFASFDEAGYHWTEVCDQAPTLCRFLQSLPYARFHRVRIMRLAPGGYVMPHRDGEGRAFGPLNIAINANASIEQNQRTLLRDLGGEEHFKALWRRFRSASARFSKCDLFDPSEVQELVSNATAEKPFFYYSNIFSTNFTLTHLSREEAEERYRRFKSVVMTRFPRVVMHGADVAGRWR